MESNIHHVNNVEITCSSKCLSVQQSIYRMQFHITEQLNPALAECYAVKRTTEGAREPVLQLILKCAKGFL